MTRLKGIFIIVFTFCNCLHLVAQIYPHNFQINGCDYTYNGLTFGPNDTIHCIGNDYQLIFEDNFDGDTLDRSKWQTYFPWGRALHSTSSGTGFTREYNADSNVIISGGNLHLVTKIDPGYRNVYDNPGAWEPPNNIYFKYTSGMLYSKMSFAAGKFEVRCKIPFIDGMWPAFWMYGHCAQEIDVFEFVNSSSTSDATNDSENMIMTYHKQNLCGVDAGGQCDNGFTRNAAKNLTNDFHVYSVEWNEYKIIWKLDDEVMREVYRIWNISPPFPQGPLLGSAAPIKNCSELNNYSPYTVFNTFPSSDNSMNIILGSGVAFDRGNYPTEFVIDYVRAYTATDTAKSNEMKSETVSLFPNPSNCCFSVSENSSNNPLKEVIVINTLGNIISDNKEIINNRTTINLIEQPKGIYFVKIIRLNNYVLKKIVIN